MYIACVSYRSAQKGPKRSYIYIRRYVLQNILNISFFSGKVWFNLSDYVNSQSYRVWSAENPHVYRETALHAIQVGVWIANSQSRIVGRELFYDTINAVRYLEQILESIITQLDEKCNMVIFNKTV